MNKSPKKTLQHFVFSDTPLGFLGRLFGALSLFAIIRHAFDVGLSASLAAILDIYNVAIRSTIGLLDPIAEALVGWLKSLLSINLVLVDEWRHIFLTLELLFIRDAGTAYSDGRRKLAFVRLVIGTAIAFSVAVLAFASHMPSSILSNVFLCTIPILGLLIYDLCMYSITTKYFFNAIGEGESEAHLTRHMFLRIGIRRSFVRFFVVLIGSLVPLVIPNIRHLPFPAGGVVGILFGLITNAGYWIVTGALYARQQQQLGMQFMQAFRRSEAGRFGLAVAGLLFWLFVFCAINAGMRILGF